MQITIDLPPDLEQDLIRQAAQSNIPLQTLILQALRQLIQSKSGPTAQWSEVILSYEGSPDFPTTRHPELVDQQEKLLETIAKPEQIQAGDTGELLAIRFYPQTALTSKFMVVAYREVSKGV